ncbi:MAG TPA: FAD-dependent oxidoreductase, partial [Nitrospirota bacterium]
STQLLYNRYGRKISNCLELANSLTRNQQVREVLNSGSLITGNDPDNMPSNLFNLAFGGAYGNNRPFYPEGGSDRLPELLAEVITENGGGIVFNASPRSIITDKEKALGVSLDGRDIFADNIISSTGIGHTVHSLVGKENFPQGFLTSVGYYKEGFPMASLFVVLKGGVTLIDGARLYAKLPKNSSALFRVLKDGKFPEKGAYTFTCSGRPNSGNEGELTGVVRFLVPKGQPGSTVEKADIENEAGKAVRELESLVPGLSADIVRAKLLTPWDFAEQFGFLSVYTPVADSVNYPKHATELPLAGLYCVGSTVQPAGSCAVSSMFSGRDCAKAIIKKGV